MYVAMYNQVAMSYYVGGSDFCKTCEPKFYLENIMSNYGCSYCTCMTWIDMKTMESGIFEFLKARV